MQFLFQKLRSRYEKFKHDESFSQNAWNHYCEQIEKKTIYKIKIEKIFNRQFELEKQRKNRQLHEFQTQTIDKKMLEFLYLRWVIIVNFFFDQTVNDDFRVFLHYINVFVNSMFSRFDNTIKKRDVEFFKKNQKRIEIMLRQSIFDIHITCDVWNFSNHLNLLIVVFHFVNENMQQQIILLALKKLQKIHFDENMIQIVFATLNDYEIRNKLNYFVMNNAKNNDIMMKIISKTLRLQHDIDYDSIEHRLRCLNYIINLIVQAYFFDKHFDVEYRIIINIRQAKKLNVELQKYRKLEFQNRFHNINFYIFRISQRVQRFTNINENVMFKRNQNTRWNVWYLMMNWVLRKIRKTINIFVNEKFELKDDRLFAFDWQTLIEMKNFLKIFHDVILFDENREFTINRILFMMNFLMHKFEIEISLHDSKSILILFIDANFQKFEKYWNIIIQRNSNYIVAIVLNLRQKWNYFQHWNVDELVQIKRSLQKLWIKYNICSITISTVDETNINDEMFEFLQWMTRNQFIVTHQNELQQYFMKSRIANIDNILIYWKS